MLGIGSINAQQHLLPIKKVIGEVDYTITKLADDHHWQTIEDGGYLTVKKGVAKIDCGNGQRRVLQLQPNLFQPKGNYTIEFKIKVPYVSEKGRGFDISVYDGLKAFDFNINAKQLTDYAITKVFTENTDFATNYKTVRFAVERYVGIVHIYIDGAWLASYIMRKPTKEKLLKIGKGQSSSAAVIELANFYADDTGAYRPN
ncbi:hypothetical protein [Pedobacter helvus]|uniref:Uncharacterized protein n=1 Tax=Pedobacter helvus TaxID=2563444 RepID=A0ABW9JMV4_9SPHI|nr:hypothetical protein [Pedobacter ureilyticus]